VPEAPPAQEPAQLDALVADEADRPPLLTHAPGQAEPAPSEAQLRLEEARRLARENPVAVANIVKDWIGSEAPA